MGVTGSGKSSFISHCVGKNKPTIGHSQFSCTLTVSVYPCRYSDDVTVYLIDTPGFNDTEKSDTDVLCELASWLTATYKRDGVKLHGVIYLHRIVETRMQGSMRTNLGLLKSLVGKQNLRNVVLTTTNWDLVSPDIGAQREKELIETPEFWGEMVSQKSTTFRHDNTRGSALELITRFVEGHKPVVLALQDQMVNQNMSLDQTAAGQSFVAEEKERYERRLRETQAKLAQAIGEKDEERKRVLEKIERNHAKQLQNMKREHKCLQANVEALWKEKYDKLQQQFMEMQMSQLSLPSTDVTDPRGQTIQDLPTHVHGPVSIGSRTVSNGSGNRLPASAGLSPKPLSDKEGMRLPFLRPDAGSPGSRTSRDNRKSLSPSPSASPSPSPSPSSRTRYTLEDLKSFARSKPEFHQGKPGWSATLSNPYYSLDGPNRCFQNLPCDLEQADRIVLGSNESWLVFKPGAKLVKLTTSDNFKVEYPTLHHQFNPENLERWGRLINLVLGPDEHCYVKFERKSLWYTGEEKLRTLLLAGKKPELLTMGVQNSFIVKWKDGTIDYNIPQGTYDKLEAGLAAIKDPKHVKILALEPSGARYLCILDQGCLIRSRSSDHTQRFAFEEYCTLNAGVSWGTSSKTLDTGEVIPAWLLKYY